MLTTAHENQETDSTRPEVLSLRASNSEIDNDSQDESASQVSAATQSVVHGDVDETGPHTSRSQSEQPARESGFSECIAALYKEFDTETCPPPPPPRQVDSLFMKLKKKSTATNTMRSTPVSALVTNTMNLVDEEVRGKTPGKPTLTTGKCPFMKSSPRTKTYKVHTPSLALSWPPLDKDAAKVDSNPGSFKTVPIDRTSFHQLAESSRNCLRAFSLHDWFSGLAGQHSRDKDPTKYEALAEAASKCATFATEVTARQHASLLLMERDAWLERPSVQLSKELKQTARSQPYSPHSLFGDSLAALAVKSAKDRQNEIWLHGTPGKQNKASAPKGSTVKLSVTNPTGKGKQTKKPFKKRAQGRGQTSQVTKRGNQSGFKTPRPADQRS